MNNSQLIPPPVPPPARPAAAPPEPLTAPSQRLRQAVAALPRATERDWRPRRRRFGAWLNRPRRVLLTLAAIWVVAVFDLGFTQFEAGTSHFVELNPVAAQIVGGSPTLLTAYKFTLLGVATAILLILRRHLVAELACWLILAIKFYLALRWLWYFDCLFANYPASVLDVG